MTDQQPNADTVENNSAAMCCAQFYEQDIVQELMGSSYHPGGKALSKRLVSALGLAAGSSVLDVACGVGTTTHLMASEFGLNATGVDFSKINVAKAAAMVSAFEETTDGDTCCGPGETCDQETVTLTAIKSTDDSNAARATESISSTAVNFVQGSADSLEFADGHFDGLTCECAVSTFEDQIKVAHEFYRVLRPGGVLGITDMVLNGTLPVDVAEKMAPWTCVAKAMSAAGYQQLFSDAGFHVAKTEDHADALLQLATEMKRKLVMASMGKALGALPGLGMDLKEMRQLLAQATELVKENVVSYGLFVFQKP